MCSLSLIPSFPVAADSMGVGVRGSLPSNVSCSSLVILSAFGCSVALQSALSTSGELVLLVGVI